MALEATHIRFALDVLERHQVSTLREYLSGTIYPDSRYVTGIDRTLTHNEDILDEHFSQSDFTKGWQVHCICDDVQRATHQQLFPDFHIYEGQKKFIYLTALKLFQDISDAREVNVLKYLSLLDYAYNPNGEDIKKINQYNQIIQETYLEGNITPSTYYKMCIKLEFDQKLTNTLIGVLEEMIKAPYLVKQIRQCYTTMMGEYNKRWRNSNGL